MGGERAKQVCWGRSPCPVKATDRSWLNLDGARGQIVVVKGIVYLAQNRYYTYP